MSNEILISVLPKSLACVSVMIVTLYFLINVGAWEGEKMKACLWKSVKVQGLCKCINLKKKKDVQWGAGALLSVLSVVRFTCLSIKILFGQIKRMVSKFYIMLCLKN